MERFVKCVIKLMHFDNKNEKKYMFYTVSLCVAKRSLFLLFNFCVHGLLTVEEMGWAPRSREQAGAAAAAGREKQKTGPSELW